MGFGSSRRPHVPCGRANTTAQFQIVSCQSATKPILTFTIASPEWPAVGPRPKKTNPLAHVRFLQQRTLPGNEPFRLRTTCTRWHSRRNSSYPVKAAESGMRANAVAIPSGADIMTRMIGAPEAGSRHVGLGHEHALRIRLNDGRFSGGSGGSVGIGIWAPGRGRGHGTAVCAA